MTNWEQAKQIGKKGYNLFKRKNGQVKVWLVMINYWDEGRTGYWELEWLKSQELLGIGKDMLGRNL